MTATRFIGLMSGTSLDGVDAVLLSFNDSGQPSLEASQYQAFSTSLRQELLALNFAGHNEIERSEILGNQLSRLYAGCIDALLRSSGFSASDIVAIGCHGQTIRHRPELGFTVQIVNAALLAELTSITVVADFRRRDVAAGGQGAPLVPAFHLAVFAHTDIHRVIVNIGGISNLSDLAPNAVVSGFDCGPGNLLMDAWINRHDGQAYDRDGAWAATGNVIPQLLQALLQHPFLAQVPPKSTGRDTFHMAWLESLLLPSSPAVDVQATLLEFSALCIVDAINSYCAAATEIYVCGGGAHNSTLIRRLQTLLGQRKLSRTDDLNIAADWVEAAAFAWLARQTLNGLPGNLAKVTGAVGPRILGCITPA